MHEWWRGDTASTWAVPLRGSASGLAVADGYIALARIRRNAQLLADWHLPRHAQSGSWPLLTRSLRTPSGWPQPVYSRALTPNECGGSRGAVQGSQEKRCS
jgi:hypothetical protein